MLNSRIAIGMLVLAVLASLSSLLAIWGTLDTTREARRGVASDSVIEGLQEVAALAERVQGMIGRIGVEGRAVDTSVADLRSAATRTLGELRRNIALEIAIERNTEAREVEIGELEIHAALARDLTAALDLLDRAAATPEAANRLLALARSILEDDEASGFRGRLVRHLAAERQQAAEATDAIVGRMARARVVAIGALLLILLFIGGLVWYHHAVIHQPVTRVEATLDRAMDGDLKVRIGPVPGPELAGVVARVDAYIEQRADRRAALLREQEQLQGRIQAHADELRAVNERLSMADERRRQLFADISHELRTPITAIRGEAEIALRGRETSIEAHAAALGRIATTSVQLGRLVDDLLFISRVDARAHRMTMAPVSLRYAIDAAIAQVRIAAEEAGIELVRDVDPADVVVFGDRDRLQQLFVILLDNAVRYSVAPARVEVAYRNAEGAVDVSIRDHGVGIPEREFADVFERFYRGGRALALEAPGSGLGLPIAKAIVEAHGGSIRLDSVEHEGTTVTVTLTTLGRVRAVA